MVLLERNAKQETKQLSKLEFWLLKDYYNEESSFSADIKEQNTSSLLSKLEKQK